MENLVLILYLLSLLFYFLSYFFKHKFFSRLGLIFLSTGLLCSFYLASTHFYTTQRLPLTNTSETLFSLVTLVVLVYLALEWKLGLPRILGLSVSLISLSGLYLAFYFFKKPLLPLLPALQSRWLVFHVSSCIVAYGFFTLAFICAIIYLARSNPALIIFSIMHRSISVGFLFLTLGIILGSIWGKSAWGHWWNWDPKETWALITWFIYAGYMHAKLFGNWPKRKLAQIAVLGFLSCLFTYLGVNYILRGLHSYA
ncbi:MAG: cytochrome c biogenesis protein CcsA [Candidatus Omnitrophota bacterium]